MSISLLFTQIRDYIHSLYFCLKLFPFKDAIKTPINISHQVKIGNVYRGAIELIGPLYHNRVFIGHQGYSAIAENEGLINIELGGKLIIEGTARFAQGVRIWIDQNATISIGDNFYCNKNCLFRAFDNITIGNNVLMGWDIEMNTTDGHHIIIDGHEKVNHGSISIGNHVWIASHVIFAKKSSVADDCVVAQRSLVSTNIKCANTLIGGIPARELKQSVVWNK